MNSNDIFFQACLILAEQCKIEGSIKLESHLKNDLNLDSIGAVKLIIEIDKVFQIDIEEASGMQIPSTVQDLVNMVEKALQTKAKANYL